MFMENCQKPPIFKRKIVLKRDFQLFIHIRISGIIIRILIFEIIQQIIRIINIRISSLISHTSHLVDQSLQVLKHGISYSDSACVAYKGRKRPKKADIQF